MIYTKVGDSGTTKTYGGKTVLKNDCLIEINGNIDSLQASLDKVIYGLDILDIKDKDKIKRVQTLLSQLGAEISYGAIDKLSQPIQEKDLEDLENWIEELNIKTTHFWRFTQPIAMDVDESRVRTRHLERNLVTYLTEKTLRKVSFIYINRLSSYLFAVSVRIEEKYGDNR